LASWLFCSLGKCILPTIFVLLESFSASKPPRRQHQTVIGAEAIVYASKKSSREIISIPEGMHSDELELVYSNTGRALFKYFVKYCGDPASTAYDSYGKHYSQIARENFRNRTIQMERMNAGWRYQHIAKDTARLSKRFENVSDLNAIEADFNVSIKMKNSNEKLNIYVSVKNRSNTMGGQDWPKAIAALENAAISDKNRSGNYICVFGIAMEKGLRNIKYSRSSGTPHSINTEVWNSDFFWPFFSNYSYDEITKSVLNVLLSHGKISSLDIEIPEEVINSFGKECIKYGLVDENGHFNDAHKLVDLFCGKL
jgi:hypothetical protein